MAYPGLPVGRFIFVGVEVTRLRLIFLERKYVDNARCGFCPLFRKFRYFLQQGCEFCLCFFVFLGFFIVIEGESFVCSASVVKPADSFALDVRPDIQNFSLKINDVFGHVGRLKNEIAWWPSFNFSDKQFNVTSEPLSLQRSIVSASEPEAYPKADKSYKKWYEKLLHHWRFFCTMFFLGFCIGKWRGRINRMAWSLVGLFSWPTQGFHQLKDVSLQFLSNKTERKEWLITRLAVHTTSIVAGSWLAGRVLGPLPIIGQVPTKLWIGSIVLALLLLFLDSSAKIYSYKRKINDAQSDAKNLLPSSGENGPLQTLENQRNTDVNK